MENALLMRVSVFTDQGGRKYMEDVTEVVVEPESGEDEQRTDEKDECKDNSTIRSVVGSVHSDCSTGGLKYPISVAASTHFTQNDDQSIPTSLLTGRSSSPAQADSETDNHPHRSVAFFAVFDGHGGSEAAQFARDYLWEFIKKQRGFWSKCDEEVCSAIRKGFVACHHAMWKKLRKLCNTKTMLANVTVTAPAANGGSQYVVDGRRGNQQTVSNSTQ